MCDITDKEFEEIHLPFYNNINDYLNNHINSAVDVFNCRYDINILIPKVKEILKIKYNLVVRNTNPLRLKRYY